MTLDMKLRAQVARIKQATHPAQELARLRDRLLSPEPINPGILASLTGMGMVGPRTTRIIEDNQLEVTVPTLIQNDDPLVLDDRDDTVVVVPAVEPDESEPVRVWANAREFPSPQVGEIPISYHGLRWR